MKMQLPRTFIVNKVFAMFSPCRIMSFESFRTLLFVTLIARTCGIDEQTPPPFKEPLLLFISFDGFRWDYLTKTDTPNFDKLTNTGVQADYVYDAYITKTFPNHYTMVTGLYEESHGIVANNMYDPDLDAEFKIGTDSIYDPVWWDQGEPVWVTNQIQGGQSGSINYVGSDVKIRGMYPTYHLPKYNGSMPYHERIDRLIPLFANGSINLGLLYFDEPDHSGHYFGPDSELMLPVIQQCDETVGYLLQQLEQYDLYDKINIVITADHGMTEVFVKDKLIYIDDYINTNCCRIIENNPIVMVWPYNDSDVNSIYQSLKDAHPNLDVYLHDDIPEQFHYTDNVRIPPILAVAQEHYQLFGYKESYAPMKGEHGYNNSLMTMHPFFVAHGPSFKEDYKMKPFRNVDIYPLLCHLLGIEPSPNNGSLEEVKMMLKEGEVIISPTASQAETTTTSIRSTRSPTHKDMTETPVHTNIKESLSMHALIGLGAACFIALIAMLLLIAMCVRQRSYRQPVYEYMPIEDTSLEGQQALAGPHASYFYPNTKI